MTSVGQKRLHELDNHSFIDVCGIRERVTEEKNGIQYLGNSVLGIEVKVSLNDYKNGFILSSCNYNYLLTPMKMLAPGILPNGVGLIEFNKYKWSYDVSDNGLLDFQGLRVVKKPQYHSIPQFQADGIIASLIKRPVPDPASKIIDKLQKNII